MENFSGLDIAKKQRPKNYQGILRCRPKNSEAVAMRSGAHGGLICPLEKGVSGDWDVSSDAGPELASRENHAAMESPQALIAPLKRGSGGLKLTRGVSGFRAAA